MIKKLSLMILVLLVLMIAIAGVTAYSYQIPVCNSTLNTTCIPITSTATNSTQKAVIYYQDGFIYLTNDTNLYNNYTNITYTNITYLTYMINYTNGSSFIFQPNITINDGYVRDLFQQVYSASNFSNFYNKTTIDSKIASLGSSGDLDFIKNSLATYATKNDLALYDIKLNNLNNVNSLNWSLFNLTAINEHIDNGGDFSITWKVIVIIEAIVIILLLLFVVKSMMSGGGDY